MSKFIEENNQVEVVKETDVIVVGGGVAGVAAAVAAARNGAKVTLIEKTIILGGLATAGHVCIYLPIDDGAGNKVFGGLAEELLHICIKYGYDNLAECWRDQPDTVENPTGRYRTNFNIPAAVLALDEFVKNEGVDVMFDTVFSAPIMEGNTVKGIIVENKSGRTAYMAKMFIDASGDSDLMFRAGADVFDNPTICSHWTHELDFETMKKGMEMGSMLEAAPLRWFGSRPDVANKMPMYYGTTADGVNSHVKVGRELMLEYLKENQRPDYAYATLPSMAQVRMTRHLVGKEYLNIDVEPMTYVEHSIGTVCNPLDEIAACYEFPYEALISDKLTNVAAAGRMASVKDTAGWQFHRSIPGCVLTGEACGTAAALAIKSGQDYQTLDIAELQKTMEAAGVTIHCTPAMKKEHYITFADKLAGKAKAVVGGTEGIRIDTLKYDEEETESKDGGH